MGIRASLKACGIAQQAPALVNPLLKDARCAMPLRVVEGVSQRKRSSDSAGTDGVQDMKASLDRRTQNHVTGSGCEHGRIVGASAERCCIELHIHPNQTAIRKSQDDPDRSSDEDAARGWKAVGPARPAFAGVG